MKLQNRKICLLVDNAGDHNLDVNEFSNLKIIFIAPNMTSIFSHVMQTSKNFLKVTIKNC
jgi:hypothetical protein